MTFAQPVPLMTTRLSVRLHRMDGEASRVSKDFTVNGLKTDVVYIALEAVSSPSASFETGSLFFSSHFIRFASDRSPTCGFVFICSFGETQPSPQNLVRAATLPGLNLQCQHSLLICNPAWY